MMPIGTIQTHALPGVSQQNINRVDGEIALLPLPEALCGDPLMALYALQAQSRRSELNDGIKEVRTNRQLRDKALKEYKAALKKAKEARKKGGFWRKAAKLCNKLGKYGSVVAAVAIVVGTGGAGAPAVLAIAGAAMSSASLLQDETRFLQKMGMSDDMAGKFQVGLGVGGAACTGGASGLASASATVEAVQSGVAVTSCAATITGGVATIQEGRYESKALKHESNALAARLQEEQLIRLFNQVLDDIQSDEQSEERTMSHLRGAIETRDATPLIVAGRV